MYNKDENSIRKATLRRLENKKIDDFNLRNRKSDQDTATQTSTVASKTS